MTAPPFFDRATCPRCLGITGSDDGACCVCHGAKVLWSWLRLCEAVRDIWAQAGCPCRACQAIGPGWRE